jgi:putative peptidoglycan lipid II flippase
VLTAYFGVSEDLAVFYLAEKIPNLIYSVIIVGAVSTVFIPVFTGLLGKDKKKAYETASATMNATLIFFLFFCVLMFVFSDQLMALLLTGAKATDSYGQKVLLGGKLIKLMAIGQIFLVAGSLLTSLLQSFKYFLLPALAPIAFNIGIIICVIFLSPDKGIYAAAYGVILGSIFHFLIQIPLVKRTNFKYRLSLNLRDKGLMETIKLIPPRLFSVLTTNISGIFTNGIALMVSFQAVVYLKLAVQLQSLPVNLFGLSMASAALPTLSGETENMEKFKKTFLTSLHQTMYLVLPVSAILFVLRLPAVRLTYGVSNFPWEATVYTSYILAFYSISIFAQSANYLITRAFYALKDTITPIKIGFFTTIINVALSYLLIAKFNFGAEAVAIAFSATTLIDSVALIIFLNKKVGGFDKEKLIKPFVKIAFSAFLMAITLYIPMKVLDIRVLDTTRTLNLIILTFIAGVSGIVTYLFFTKIFKVEEIELLYKLIRKLNLQKKTVPVPSSEAGINS